MSIVKSFIEDSLTYTSYSADIIEVREPTIEQLCELKGLCELEIMRLVLKEE